MRRRLEIWSPEFNPEKGGIQAFSCFLLKAALEGRSDLLVRGRAKLPRNEHHRAGLINARLRTLRFPFHLALPNFFSPPALIISSHVNFATVAQWLFRLRRVPYVVVAHGREVWGPMRPSRLKALRESTRVWAVSHYTYDRLITEQNVAREKVSILPNTFSDDRFSPGPKPAELMARYHLPPTAKVIFSVGRLSAAEQYKGFDRIIQALPRVQVAFPEVYYVIGGRGDDEARLRALASAFGVGDRVLFAGFIKSEEMCPHYRLSDVFGLPSTGEGFGIVFLEALACGCPVLAGNRDGSREPLGEGRFGKLIDPLDLSQIAQGLIELLSMGKSDDIKASREALITQFGRIAFARRFLKNIEGLIPLGNCV